MSLFNLKYICRVIFILIPLVSVKAYAMTDFAECGNDNLSGRYELIASWEMKAESDLWNGKVEKSVFSENSDKVTLNSFCSNKLTDRISSTREILDKLVKCQISSGYSSQESVMALKLLENSIKFIDADSVSYDINLISKIHNELPMENSWKRVSGIDKSPLQEKITEKFCSMAGITQNTSSGKTRRIERGQFRKTVECHQLSVCGYLWDRELCDVYGLFLYIKDNTSGLHIVSDYINTSEALPSFFKFSNLHYNLKNLTKLYRTEYNCLNRETVILCNLRLITASTMFSGNLPEENEAYLISKTGVTV